MMVLGVLGCQAWEMVARCLGVDNSPETHDAYIVAFNKFFDMF
jgi:hypothetical protein